MATPLIEDLCLKVSKPIGYWDNVTATTTAGVTTWTFIRTGRTANFVVTLNPPLATVLQSPLVTENTLAKIALAVEQYCIETQNG